MWTLCPLGFAHQDHHFWAIFQSIGTKEIEISRIAKFLSWKLGVVSCCTANYCLNITTSSLAKTTDSGCQYWTFDGNTVSIFINRPTWNTSVTSHTNSLCESKSLSTDKNLVKCLNSVEGFLW